MPSSLLKLPEFRAFLFANTIERFSASGMTVLLGFQVYELTRNPLDLGLLGLMEAVPGIGLVLFGGHFADILSRRRMLIVTIGMLAFLSGLLSLLSGLKIEGLHYFVYLVGFSSAGVRAFQSPAATGLEAQVLPQGRVMEGVPIIATCARTADVIGPVGSGFFWAYYGGSLTYSLLTGLFLISTLTIHFGISEKVYARSLNAGIGIFKRIREGIRYVFSNEILVGSMGLDLFAVFFGGATALLPLYASDILHVGAEGFGLLRSATAAGALTAAVIATRFMPSKHAGAILHAVIAIFGVSMIVFGLSTIFWLSLLALFVSGLCDGISMVIRHAIMRLASPEEMRGRIAAVRSVFVGSSNELGALESGMAAHYLGPVMTVWGGGVITIAVVAFIALRSPYLRTLNLAELKPAPV
ncbi:MAG: MFS transporter [Methylocystaceae bacterium]|nr:MFS transporter [Methylocystaceae bacterium]